MSHDIYTPADQWPTFADWCSEQTCFARFDRDNTEIDTWLVVPYTYCPNVSELLDDSNWAAIQAALTEADPECKDHDVRYHSHWATGYKMVLVRPDTPALKAMDQLIARLADYPVLDESDFSERETAAQFESVTDELGRLELETNGEPLTDDAINGLASEICSKASDNETMGADNVRDALGELGWVECEDDIWRPVAETEDDTTPDPNQLSLGY